MNGEAPLGRGTAERNDRSDGGWGGGTADADGHVEELHGDTAMRNAGDVPAVYLAQAMQLLDKI